MTWRGRNLLIAAALAGMLAAGSFGTAALACSVQCEKGSCESGRCTGIAVCKCTADGRPKCKCYGKNSIILTSAGDELVFE